MALAASECALLKKMRDAPKRRRRRRPGPQKQQKQQGRNNHSSPSRCCACGGRAGGASQPTMTGARQTEAQHRLLFFTSFFLVRWAVG